MRAFYGIYADNKSCTTVGDISPCVFNQGVIAVNCVIVSRVGDSNS